MYQESTNVIKIDAADTGEAEDNGSVLSGWGQATHRVPDSPNINIDRDYVIAKGYLQTIGSRNESVWDHLTDILNHVMKERPPDCMRYFEELSRELRIKKFFFTKGSHSLYREIIEEPKDVEDAKQMLKFYRKVECLYESETPFDDKFGTMDLLPTFKLLNEAGIGFSFTEVYNIQMAIRYLAKSHPVAKIKFWGKVFGTLRDYIIVEAELTPEAMENRFKSFIERAADPLKNKEEMLNTYEPTVSHVLSPIIDNEEFVRNEYDEEDTFPMAITKTNLELYVKPPIPVPSLPEEIVIPSEPPGHGVNRKVYYVANDPSDEWCELPDVTPEQIVKARFLHRYLTGVLTSEVPGFPKFPGLEREYLRAQIARITSSTHCSPLGFYSAGGEDEAVVEIEEGQLYSENVDYQPLPIKDLLDPTLEFWVHHEPYILKQGRTEFWSPPSNETEEEADMEEEDMEKEREKGPPILNSLSADATLEGVPWTVRRASTLINEDSAVVLRSITWPGAVTAVKDRLFVNVYVGWAVKSSPKGFNPHYRLNVQKEYELGPEVMEMADPTVEMEEFRWMQLHPKMSPKNYGEEEEGEGEWGEEEHEE